MNDFHVSVLLNETIEFLKVSKGKWYLDATVGDGGHSLEILKRGGKVFGIDADPEALKRTQNRFEDAEIAKDQYMLREGNFRSLDVLNTQNLSFAGEIFDLGVSSLQLDTAERGFSFSKSGPLDMRMSPDLQVAAVDLVNGLNKGELYELFKKYAEEKDYAVKKLSEAIVRSRPIKTTDQLKTLVEETLGRRKFDKIHPATRIFQALRIAVNDELNSLREALPKGKEVLEEEGRMAVISFHSLEDRIVKNQFLEWQKKREVLILTDKPIVPSEIEISANRRSRSAKMRVIEKI